MNNMNDKAQRAICVNYVLALSCQTVAKIPNEQGDSCRNSLFHQSVSATFELGVGDFLFSNS